MASSNAVSCQLIISDQGVTLMKEKKFLAQGPTRYDDKTLESRTLKALDAMRRENRLRAGETKLLGEYLYGVLLDNDVGVELKRLAAGIELLQVELNFPNWESSKLAGLPWEYLFWQNQSKRAEFLATNPHVALVRCPPGDKYLTLTVTPTETDSKLRVLLVVSSPSDLDPLQFEGLKTAIEGWDDLVELDTLITPHSREEEVRRMLSQADDKKPQATYEAFKSALSKKPHVIHFLGHGRVKDTKAEIAFVNSGFNADWKDGKELANDLCEECPSVRLAFLQACDTDVKGDVLAAYRAFSSMADKLVNSTNIPAIVAMQANVRNQPANDFAEMFYTALIKERQPIYWAMQKARRRSEEDAAACIPVLYLGQDQSGTNMAGLLLPKLTQERSQEPGASTSQAVSTSTPRRICPWCGEPVARTDNCMNCGSPLICRHCGFAIPEDLKIDRNKRFIRCGDDPDHKMLRFEEPAEDRDRFGEMEKQRIISAELPKQKDTF